MSLTESRKLLPSSAAGPLPLPAGPESWLPLTCGVCESPEGVSVTAGDFVFGAVPATGGVAGFEGSDGFEGVTGTS